MNHMKHSIDSTAAHERLQQNIRVEIGNMDDLHRRINRLLECGCIHTEELAQACWESTQRPEQRTGRLDIEAIAAFQERAALPYPSAAMDGNERLLAQLYSHLTTTEQICFYRTLVDKIHDSATLAAHLLGRTEPIESFARGAIAYQHSIYADEAFLHFSRALPGARAVYSDNFTGVCEQVFNGLCEYCILPLENTQDGKLVRFYSLIEKYELKIVLTCNVTTSDNRHSTVFGLCRRGLTWPMSLLPEKSFCFEFVFWQEPEHVSLSKLLTAASACSLSLLRADCRPRSDDEILIGAGHPFDVCFEVSYEKQTGLLASERDFLAFLLYLSVHSPTYLPLGIYQMI